MKFTEFVGTLEKLQETSSRLAITKILTGLFSELSSAEIRHVTNLILGRLAPSWEGKVFNVAERMMILAIAQAYGQEVTFVRRLYKEKGDLGDVAYAAALPAKLISNDKLTVEEVYGRLLEVADDEGEKSVERKIGAMAEILKGVSPNGAKFVVRIVLGKLRLGFSDKTILDVLSFLIKGDKSVKKELEMAYFVLPDVGLLAERVKKDGAVALREPAPVVGVPALPMLAQRLKDPVEMIKKMGKVAVEPKFDGLRILIHYKRGEKTKAFTRNLNEVSGTFPELLEIGVQVKAREAIFDSEAVGLSEDALRIVNFQTTMTRRRKHDISNVSRKTPVRFQVFDVLAADGRNYLFEDYMARRKKLTEIIHGKGVLVVDDYVLTDDPHVIESEYRRQIEKGLEGVIVKKVDSEYVAGRTGWRWVKMKDEVGKHSRLSDTVDCVVMGYYRGRGKRVGFGMGGFLVGLPEKAKILTVTKIGTGLTDEQFREIKSGLDKLEVGEKPGEYGDVGKNLIPDVWVKPSLVVEIAADEITKSPMYSAGYSLRFPRLVRFRNDKNVEQATSVLELVKLYRLQN